MHDDGDGDDNGQQPSREEIREVMAVDWYIRTDPNTNGTYSPSLFLFLVFSLSLLGRNNKQSTRERKMRQQEDVEIWAYSKTVSGCMYVCVS